MATSLHPCCDTSSTVPIWKGEPTGKLVSIDGIEAYLSSPPETPSASTANTHILLFLTEAHGIHLPNAQLLADSFSRSLNIPVLMPDEFHGPHQFPTKDMDPDFSKTIPWIDDKDDVNFENRGLALPLKIDTERSDALPFAKPKWWGENRAGEKEFVAWKGRHEIHVTDKILDRVVSYCYDTYGKDIKIGGVGYCFGGRYVIRLMGKGVISVGVANHASFYTLDEVALLGEGARLALFSAERDEILPKEKRRATEDLLAQGNGVVWQSTLFGGTEHGFAMRGDLGVKEVRAAKEKAFEGAVGWFREWLLSDMGKERSVSSPLESRMSSLQFSNN